MVGQRLVVGLALVVALAACGDDDSGTGGEGAATTGATSATTTGPAAGGSASSTTSGGGEAPDTGGPGEVTIASFAFQPASLTVPAGSEVSFVNDDGVSHTVTAGTAEAADPEQFHEVLAAGQSTSITFQEAGTVTYHCSLHPTMVGEVVVQ